METLQSVLKEKRNYLKLSLRNAADLIGISHSHLRNLEQGSDPRTGAPIKPTPELLELISKAYKIDYNYLMSLSGYLSMQNDTSYKDDDTNNFINMVKEEVERYGYNIKDKSKDEIIKLIVNAIKIDEITKSN